MREYEETFTALLMHQGMPRMTARVMTCLLIADSGSVTAAELVQRLGVSPATVSKSIASLQSQGLISRERDEGRRERYFVDGDVWYESTIDSARGMAKLAEVARQGVTVLGRDTSAGVRLENMARFGDHISEASTAPQNKSANSSTPTVLRPHPSRTSARRRVRPPRPTAAVGSEHQTHHATGNLKAQRTPDDTSPGDNNVNDPRQLVAVKAVVAVGVEKDCRIPAGGRVAAAR